MTEPDQKILLICLQGAGNAILTLPLAQGLKTRWPESELTLLVSGDRIGNVCLSYPAVDRYIAAQGPQVALMTSLRKARYDLAVFAFPCGFRSHLLAWTAGIKQRVGHRIPGRRAFRLTTEVQPVSQAHDLEQNEQLAVALGATTPLDRLWPPLRDIPPAYVERGKRYLEKNGLDPDARYLGIHTGSDPRFVEKRFLPESFARVAEAIHADFGLPALVFDGPSEPGSGLRVKRSAQAPVHALCGWGDLCDAWGLMAVCDLFVSNDSGLMNLAEASGIPTIGIFGPSQVHRTRPYGGRTVCSDWPCSPCYSLTRYAGCPFSDRHCLEDLSWKDIVETAGKVLER